MHRHAPSQITEAETVRLLLASLADPISRGTLRLERGRALGDHEMLGFWTLDTPEGRIYPVAIVRVIDGEPMGFDEAYRDHADALAAWQHLVDVYAEACQSSA